MTTRTKTATLNALRERIARIERRPVLAAHAVAERAHGNGLLATPPGLMHEIFTDTTRNGAAALGFALGQARPLIDRRRPALIYLQLAREAQEFGLPYASGFSRFGIDPEAVILTRAGTISELLWAAEEALACQAVAAVIADVGGAPKQLDFTASRRLGMRAASTGVSLFILRYGIGREASATTLRWHLSPAVSGETPFDPKAPGAPRWRVTLEKGVVADRVNGVWLLEWHGDGFDLLDPGTGEQAGGNAPLHGAGAAVLANRFSQTG